MEKYQSELGQSQIRAGSGESENFGEGTEK